MSNQKEVIASLTRQFMAQQSIDDEVKSIKEKAKEAGLNVPVLVAVAKAIVNNKVDELKEKSDATLATIQIARS